MNSILNPTASHSRIPRMGKGTRVFRTNDASGLSDAQILHLAPSVFATDKHSSRSARYSYVPTSDVLEGLRREGFIPMEVRQSSSRIQGKAEFTKHLLRFRHQSGPQLRTAGDSVSEIVMVNSHDGTSSYQLMAGIFRMVCSNGLVISESPHTSIRVGHTGDARGAVIEGCIEILGNLPTTMETVREFQALDLSRAEQMAFATAALQLRYSDATQEEPAPISPNTLLIPARNGDAGSDLWRTLNVVQERTVRGGQNYVANTSNGRRRAKTREIRGIDGNLGLNRALWTLAEEMRKLKQS